MLFFVLKEDYVEAKKNKRKLQASCVLCFGSWVPDYCVLGLEHQSWYMLTTLL